MCRIWKIMYRRIKYNPAEVVMFDKDRKIFLQSLADMAKLQKQC